MRQDDTKKALDDNLVQLDDTKSQLVKEQKTCGAQTAQIAKLEAELKTAQNDIVHIKNAYVKVRDRNNNLEEEAKVRSQGIQGINDSLLSLQIENNLLNKSNAQLRTENEQLVKRWIDKVSKDADVLNEANEVLADKK